MEKRYDNISKIRLLKVWEILRTETDEDNPMGTPILLQKLANQGIKCDRRTVYRDIQLLNDFGYEILHNRGISNQYFVVDRSFDAHFVGCCASGVFHNSEKDGGLGRQDCRSCR